MSAVVTPFLIAHIGLLRDSYRHWTGASLLPPSLDPLAAVRALDEVPFAVVSHGTQPDPIFNYGNRLALSLFEMDWNEFTRLPSRLSAEAADQAERRQLLAQVSAQGYSDDYCGIRIAKTGRRFLIRAATIWNLVDGDGGYHGQAAVIRAWEDLA